MPARQRVYPSTPGALADRFLFTLALPLPIVLDNALRRSHANTEGFSIKD
jgi:hypothetical protein